MPLGNSQLFHECFKMLIDPLFSITGIVISYDAVIGTYVSAIYHHHYDRNLFERRYYGQEETMMEQKIQLVGYQCPSCLLLFLIFNESAK